MSPRANREPRAWPRIALSIAHIGIGLSGIGFCLPYVMSALSVDASENPGVFGIGVYLLAPLLTIYCLPSLICGMALLFDRNWAASILRIQAFAYALAVPVGTLLAIATWMALKSVGNRSRPLDTDAFEIAANRSRSDFLVVLIAVASGFTLLLKGLFSYYRSQSPSAVDSVFPIAAIAFVTCGIYFVPRLTARFRSRRQGPSTPPLPSGSAMPKYDASCEHVEPILRAMRHSGISYRPCDARQIQAECRFDLEELDRKFAVVDPLFLGAVPLDERRLHETADVLHCREHGITVRAMHSEGPDVRVPVFPTRPTGRGRWKRLAS